MFGEKIIFLDLETTGFSPQANEIIEIGAWRFEDGFPIDSFHRYIRPERYVPRDVMSLTGITNEFLADKETLQDVLPEFCDYCGDSVIAGYNVDFDYRFLVSKANTLGIDFTIGGMRKEIDVIKAVKQCYKNLPNYKLETVVRHLEIPIEENRFHSAKFDAYVTKLVYDKCRRLEPEYCDKTKYGKPVITDTLSFQ